MAIPGFSTIRVNNWQEFKNLIAEFSNNWAYRGQASGQWILNNAIERTDFITFHNNIEADFVAEFQRGASNYLTHDEMPQHLIEWLALMQHHGAPTRLLDLSKSPFIAAYFAFEICIPAEDHTVGIWCINVEHLKNKAIQLLTPEFGKELQESNNLINEKLFEKLFYGNNKALVFPVEPFRMNRRYSLQQSIFVSTGTSQQPFMEQLKFLGDDIEKTVVCIQLPSVYKKEALRELQQMNLHRASLFPDLDGYALSLKLRYDSMKTPAEIEEEIIRKKSDSKYNFIP